ncbi:MAG TPA: flagellar assembly protein FliW [Deltaproteobacteria bacterium]|nr:flagellar assembly protein FliW [Deltaproteobacteria bacterium]
MGERIRFESRRVGPIEVEASDVLTFEPLPGFPDRTKFVVVEHAEGSEMAWLVSLDDPDLAFVVTTPWTFFPNYDPPIEREHLASLGIEKKNEVEILTIVTLSGKSIFLNLAAPLLINATTRHGVQVISDDPRFTTRAAIPELRSTSQKTETSEERPVPPAP